jgi:hypothetical protein
MKFLNTSCIIFLLSIANMANAGLIEHVVNGDFESGNTNGWTVLNSGTTWNMNNGSFVPCGASVATAPISGAYDIVSSQCGGSIASFYQDITLASSFETISLSWIDRIRNQHSAYADPSQEFKVRLFDSNLGLISEVFSTDPGDALLQIGPNSRVFDMTSELSSYAGQQIRLEFFQQTQLFHFNVNLDNISLESQTSVPEPSTLAIFALGMIGLASRRFKKQS